MSAAMSETCKTGAETGPGLSVCVLASGSKGNCLFISDGATSLLIDAGLSGVEIERRLAVHGIDPQTLNALVISHEHQDHIQGAGVIARRYHLPVYISRKTCLAARPCLGQVEEYQYFECGATFRIGCLEIHPFSLSHDAADPAGFTFSRNGLKVGLATDLGVATAMVKEHLKGCRLLILEANHDPEMLIGGSYPWPVKQRIKGRTGHLSNNESRELLLEVKHDRLAHVILAHLSHENNTCEKALSMVGGGAGRFRNNALRCGTASVRQAPSYLKTVSPVFSILTNPCDYCRNRVKYKKKTASATINDDGIKING
jgi:phosphoribosyl 1,2-cyclic phosphodiesterase